MRIEMSCGRCGRGGASGPGDIIEVPDDEAERYIAVGSAKRVAADNLTPAIVVEVGENQTMLDSVRIFHNQHNAAPALAGSRVPGRVTTYARRRHRGRRFASFPNHPSELRLFNGK